jgi:hypothetical protein
VTLVSFWPSAFPQNRLRLEATLKTQQLVGRRRSHHRLIHTVFTAPHTADQEFSIGSQSVERSLRCCGSCFSISQAVRTRSGSDGIMHSRCALVGSLPVLTERCANGVGLTRRRDFSSASLDELSQMNQACTQHYTQECKITTGQLFARSRMLLLFHSLP